MKIITKCIKSPLLALSLLAATSSAYGQTLAFPGAKGFGRYATGARASGTRSVYLVTNLNDSGSGSFRDAVSQSGRIVVFRVGGIINLASDVVVAANTTIAGQTAPGTGIVLFGKRVTFSASNNTICRYLRVRLGATSNSGKDASGIANGANMIFDHCSFTWGMDEVFSINWDSKGNNPDNITIQNTILGQGLHRENHSCGGLIQPSTGGKVSLIGNLYTSNKTRNPKVKGINEFVNNVVYNWGNANRLGDVMNYGWSGEAYIMGGDSAGDSFANIINNYFIGGPSTNPSNSTPFTRGNANFNVYGSGNYFDNDRDGILDGTLVPYNTTGYPTDDAAALQSTPYDYPEKNTTLTAAQAYQKVCDSVGAIFPLRDELDALMISDLQSKGTSGVYVYRETDIPLANGGLGAYTAGTAATDSDNDGMPNAWETANGLNPNSASDAVTASTTNPGYLNIEVYINSLVTPVQAVNASANWALTTDQSVTGSDSNITAYAQTFASDMVSNYTTLSPTTGLYAGQTVGVQRLKPSAGWPANQTGIVSTQYSEYKVAPVAGKHFKVQTISLDFGDAGSTSVMKANVYYSLDGFATAGTLLNPSPLTLPKYSATELFTNATFSNLGIDVLSGQTLTVRVYPWWPSAASTTKYLVERNIIISGKAAPTGVVISSVPQGRDRLTLNQVEDEKELNVYPNPTNSRLTVTFPAASAGSKITIINTAGLKMLEQSVATGSSQVSQDVSGLAAGNYFLIYDSGASRKTKQFLKY